MLKVSIKGIQELVLKYLISLLCQTGNDSSPDASVDHYQFPLQIYEVLYILSKPQSYLYIHTNLQ